MRGQTVHQHRDLVLLSDPAGTADQAVRVRRYGNDQGVARPCCKMRVQRGDRRLGPTREYKIEELDVAGFALGQTGRHLLRRRQRRPCCLDVALPHQYLRLARVGQGKTRVGRDGPIMSLGRAGIECQRQIGRLDISIPRCGGFGGEDEAVAICQHEKSSPRRESHFCRPKRRIHQRAVARAPGATTASGRAGSFAMCS